MELIDETKAEDLVIALQKCVSDLEHQLVDHEFNVYEIACGDALFALLVEHAYEDTEDGTMQLEDGTVIAQEWMLQDYEWTMRFSVKNETDVYTINDLLNMVPDNAEI